MTMATPYSFVAGEPTADAALRRTTRQCAALAVVRRRTTRKTARDAPSASWRLRRTQPLASATVPAGATTKRAVSNVSTRIVRRGYRPRGARARRRRRRCRRGRRRQSIRRRSRGTRRRRRRGRTTAARAACGGGTSSALEARVDGAARRFRRARGRRRRAVRSIGASRGAPSSGIAAAADGGFGPGTKAEISPSCCE